MFDEDIEAAYTLSNLSKENKFLKEKIAGMLYIIEKANLPIVADDFKKQLKEKGININYIENGNY